MSAKQDRQGVRTASDLEQKYNFDKTFAELMGIATDARDKVDKVESTLRNEMKEQSTTISRDTEKIIMSALEEYVKTGDLEEYKKTVASELKIMADNISATVSEEQLTEVREYLDEQIAILDKAMKDSEAAFTIKADEISAKIESNTERITEVSDAVSGQVAAFEEYKSTNSSALEVLDNKISANLQSTEEKITEVLDELDGQVALIEEYKKSTESDLSVMNEQISASISSTSEQITAINQGLGEATAELEQQAMDVETLREYAESELLLLADKMQLNFETTSSQITSVNGEMIGVVEELEKHFEFGTNGLIIKAGENSMELHLDNGNIRFVKSGQEFGWWDGVDFHTGNVVVEVNERAQFGNFAFVPRSNGSLSFLKVKDENVQERTLVSISVTYSGGNVPAGTDISSLTNITVTASYSDNTTEEIDSYSMSGSIKTGTNTITVRYGGKSATFTVVGDALPKELSSISVTYNGGTVHQGTTLDSLTGITVTARYNDGSTESVTGYTLSGSITPGSNTITVSYGGKNATFNVYCESNANRTLESISATYTGGTVAEGTALGKLTGITVTAHYSDGSTETVADYSLSGSIKVGENEIWVLYEGKIAIITVVGVASASNEITLGEKTTCVVKFWMSNTTSGSIVQYASDVRVVDGVVELVNPMQHTFYMVYSGVTNDYTVLLGKYVKSANGDIYFIDTDSTYTHNTNVSAYVAENIIYNSAHRADIA